MPTDLRTHLTRHEGRRSTDATEDDIRDMIREIVEGYTFRIVHSGSGGRVAIALPTRRQRVRMKRTLAEAM